MLLTWKRIHIAWEAWIYRGSIFPDCDRIFKIGTQREMELMLLTVLPMKSPKNAIIANLWDSFVPLPGLSLFHPVCTSPYYGHMTWSGKKVWHGGLYNGRQVWGQRQGYGSRLHLYRALIQRAPSGKRALQPHAAALVELWVPDANSWRGHQLLLAAGHRAALGTPQLSDVYSMKPHRSSPPVRWCCFILQRSILDPLLSVFIYSFIYLYIFCPGVQWDQSWDINLSSEELKWEPLSLHAFPMPK